MLLFLLFQSLQNKLILMFHHRHNRRHSVFQFIRHNLSAEDSLCVESMPDLEDEDDVMETDDSPVETAHSDDEKEAPATETSPETSVEKEETETDSLETVAATINDTEKTEASQSSVNGDKENGSKRSREASPDYQAETP